MTWKAKALFCCALLLCMGALMTGAFAGDPATRVRDVDQVEPAQALSADPSAAVVTPKGASLGDATRPDGWVWTPTPDVESALLEQKLLEEMDGKPVPEDESLLLSTVVPLTEEPGDLRDGESRAWCNGDVATGTGSGTTQYYPLYGYYNNSRSSSLIKRSEITATCDPFKITQIAIEVTTAAAMNFTNIEIRMKKTTATEVTTTWDGSGTLVWSGSTTMTPVGWKVFNITDFVWDSDNLLITWQWSGTYSSTRPSYRYSTPSPSFYGQNYAYSDTQLPTAMTRVTTRTLYKLTFEPAPAVGACCDGTTCTPDQTSNGCETAGGDYQGDGSVCTPNPCSGACCVDFDCVGDMTEDACLTQAGTWYQSLSCSSFFCPPWNDNCSAVTPVTLSANVPVQFTGDNRGATNDPGTCSFTFPQVWHAITLPATYSLWDVKLDYCTTSPAFGNAYLNWATGCPCTAVSAAGAYDVTTCGDGNLTLRWVGLAPGTYYYPVLLDAATSAAGPYVINIVAKPGYCASAATSTADETIKQFVFGAISNTTADCDLYNNFTNLSTQIDRGSTYPMTLVIGDCEGASCYNKRAAIYVDWNQDYDFVDAGEMVWDSGQLTNTPCPDMTVTGNITVPVDAVLGATRMRVIVKEGSSQTVPPPPCGTYTWGATEDYTVGIQLAPPTGACCMPPDYTVCMDGDLTEEDCLNSNGIYQGDGSTCIPNPCVGACCFTDGSCQLLTEEACSNAVGAYEGDSTDCDPNPCPQPGADCDNPALVSLSPGFVTYTLSNQTNCGFGSDYQDTCLGSYDGGEDIVYELTVTGAMDITLTLDPKGTTWPGFALDDTCPLGGTGQCIIVQTETGGTPMTSICKHLEAGTYYIMVDTYPSPYCIPNFDLKFDECVLPTGRCCYDPWPSCVDGITEVDCQALYSGTWKKDTTCDSPCPWPITNEDCATAHDVGVGPCYSVEFDNSLSTASSPAPTCNGGYPTLQNDVWFKYTPTAGCQLSASFNTPPYDGVMGIWTGPNCTSLTEVACLDTPDDPGTWSTVAIPGTTYWFQIGDWGLSVGGGLTNFDLKCLAPGATGACCFGDGSCDVLTADACTAAGGSYVCDGTTCEPNPCPQPQPGDNCTLPITVNLPAGLPYSDPNEYTCGRENDYSDTCLGSYDGGEDIIYQLVVSEPICVKITASGNDASNNWIGVGVDDVCPLGNPCMAAVGVSGTVATIDGLVLAAGTYYVMVDTYPAPDCLTSFNFTIVTSTACPQGACCDGSVGGLGCYETFGDACTGAFAGDGTSCTGLDCNSNSVDDVCDILGPSEDCQPDGIPDECQLAGNDVDGNGVPDECDPDCNTNGIPDGCDVSCEGACASVPGCGESEDCQSNGVPDECELGGKRSCDQVVYDAGVCDGVNGTRPTVGWNDTGIVDKFTVPQAGGPTKFSCFHAEILDFAQTDMPNLRLRIYNLPTGSIPVDLSSFATATSIFDYTYTVANGELVISVRPVCYPTALAWDYDASGPAHELAPGSYALLLNFPGSGAVNYWASAADDGMGNGYVWGLQVDAPSDAGMALAWNLKGGAAGGDCNNNGVPDDCDIMHGTSLDCQPDGIPDECQIDGNDCQPDGIPDDCQLANNDCNENDIPDDCDIANGQSQDCQPDGIPDECQLGTGGGGTNLVADPSFEAGTPNPSWTEFSTNYGTPLCSTSSCSTSGGQAPHSGIWYCYFGGCGTDCTTFPEIGYVQQAITIPTGADTLKFWLWNHASGDPTDYVSAMMDGNTVFTTVVGNPLYTGGYALVTVDITTYANGASHMVRFESSQATSTVTNFFVDDVEILAQGSAPSNDCNMNDVPDECDIAGTTSHDYNGNGIPDECELCGDFDGDGVVGQLDYWFFLDAYGSLLGQPKYQVQCDFDQDGCVCLPDYQAWLMCYRMYVGNPKADPPAPRPRPIPAPLPRPGDLGDIVPAPVNPTPAPIGGNSVAGERPKVRP